MFNHYSVYKKYNLVTGWMAFLVAAITYLLTLEPTVSLWDCGEFIASAFKLQVGHPPGAPFFMILGRFFSLFATDVSQAARMVNALSALASAFTILFLFWTITHLVRKMISAPDESLGTSRMIIILGSGLTGALAYAFSDTFWFSAVEAEVYATSSLFTAIVFWAVLKWENVADQKYANRWLILIAYLMGLSIGVHLLNLLAIPAIVMVYYFRKYKPTTRGVILSLLLSFILLGVVMYMIIPGVVRLASLFELFFVNGLGMPFKSGVLFYIALMISGIVYGIWYTHKKQKVLLNTALVALTVMLIGYSSYATIVIRSLANPPMDENNPEQVFSLLAYLNREQYGDRPLIKGHYYNAPIEEFKEGKPTYSQVNGRYEITSRKTEIVYDDRFTTFFPRMYSAESRHVEVYKEWGDIDGTPVRITNRQGQPEVIRRPSFGENMLFFIKYQMGHMYFRYFMWNFAGRQNDVQSHGGIVDGNWISGISALDAIRLGSQQIPASLKNHPSRNTYFLLPFILGIAGLFYHASKKKKDFWVVMLLFFFTGTAIVIYLNQTPVQPRERDYAYAGSFYAFAIWIGIGVAALIDVLPRAVPLKIKAVGATLLALIMVPGLMATQNWDDHDRSGRTFARDMAYNYLNSCAPNAILFTNGDNDTFPLWYAQEVEGIRTDVRVVNLMLLNTDWYIEMMTRKAYDSEPLPISFSIEELRHGKLNNVYLFERVSGFVDLKRAIQFVASKNPETKRIKGAQGLVDHLPAKKFSLPVDTANVLSNGTVSEDELGQMLPSVEWGIDKRRITKSELVVLDFLANNNWERPVYFASGGNNSALSLEDYFQLEGFAYRLVPFKTPNRSFMNLGHIETKKMLPLYLDTFQWGGLGNKNVYFDSHNRRTLSVMRVRGNFARLAEKLIQEGDTIRALEVLNKANALMSNEQIPYDIYTISIAENFYKAGGQKMGHALARDFAMQTADELEYFVSLEDRFFSLSAYDIRMRLQYLQQLAEITMNGNDLELSRRISNALADYYQIYQERQ